MPPIKLLNWIIFILWIERYYVSFCPQNVCRKFSLKICVTFVCNQKQSCIVSCHNKYFNISMQRRVNNSITECEHLRWFSQKIHFSVSNAFCIIPFNQTRRLYNQFDLETICSWSEFSLMWIAVAIHDENADWRNIINLF